GVAGFTSDTAGTGAAERGTGTATGAFVSISISAVSGSRTSGRGTSGATSTIPGRLSRAVSPCLVSIAPSTVSVSAVLTSAAASAAAGTSSSSGGAEPSLSGGAISTTKERPSFSPRMALPSGTANLTIRTPSTISV